MKNKKAAWLLAGGTTIALASGGAAYWWAQQVNTDELPIGAAVVPQNALTTLSVSTDEGQWRKLRQYGTSTTQAIVDQNLAQWRDRLFTANGFNYQQDIQPWVGKEVTVAVLPSGTSSSAVMLLPIANPNRAQELLTKRQNAPSEVAQRDYKGIPIREFKGQQNYFSAILDQRLIAVSQDAKAIEQIIDTDKNGASIAKTQGYGQSIAQLKVTQPFMQVYVNVPAATTALATNSIQPALAKGLLPLQNNQGIVGAVTLESEGIRFQGAGWLGSENKLRYKVENRAEKMPSLLPADTMLMASGGSLKQFWQDYSQGATTGSATFLRQGINSTTGLDFDQDLIGWMDGEFSLSLLPTAAGTTPASAGLVFLVQASDRQAADAALSKLDQAMSSKYGFQVGEGQVKGQPVVNWVSRFEAVTATRGWLNGNVAFLTISPGRGSSVTGAIVPQPEKPLAADPRFQKAIASQLTPSNGHFFANLDRLANADSPLSLPYLPPQATSFLQAMQSIGVTGAIATDRTSRYDIFVTLDKNDNSKPLPSPKP